MALPTSVMFSLERVSFGSADLRFVCLSFLIKYTAARLEEDAAISVKLCLLVEVLSELMADPGTSISSNSSGMIMGVASSLVFLTLSFRRSYRCLDDQASLADFSFLEENEIDQFSTRSRN